MRFDPRKVNSEKVLFAQMEFFLNLFEDLHLAAGGDA
jgi:hypothetical protein